MEHAHGFLPFIALLLIVPLVEVQAQSPSTSIGTARALDTLLQDYAYRAFDQPLTGVIYDGQVPSYLSGIKIAALRLRSGSMRRRGVESYKEFEIPMGVIERPYVKRLALVYQNLGNWSSLFYDLPGYSFLTPMLGLLAYDAMNISATNLPELYILAKGRPISIQFTDVGTVPIGSTAQCVSFDLNGLPRFEALMSRNVCLTNVQGHFSIVVKSGSGSHTPPAPVLAPMPIPRPGPTVKEESKVWGIAGPVIGGFAAFVFWGLILVFLVRYKRKKNMAQMEHESEHGVPLQVVNMGVVRLPAAAATRTGPELEHREVP
ncbi:uncharacterized protein LOC131223790 [Magnolia sinica]|uniref:uncharacterized protein LOC131223790 n=1 Tax=Magnolia sinica TaxID=86752 RepID=UPI0026593CA3|nr:uncharacterized protein LOC131223790 [Magnolia sinica]XP_058075282.1 uncharacterized protein LOC131223790 [Magnolia sinica]XP_058075283.1 uncharacterized protein LOC131223790 [Magnolia sinica]